MTDWKVGFLILMCCFWPGTNWFCCVASPGEPLIPAPFPTVFGVYGARRMLFAPDELNNMYER